MTRARNLSNVAGISYITATDNKVGIGSTIPQSTLDVEGSAVFSGIVTAASFSGNVPTATYAESAGIATYATSSGIASYSDVTGIATYANNAGIASYSDVTGIATYATLSGIASYSDVTGIATVAQGLTGSPSITVSSITATGNVSIAGTLTYEDVTNVDSIGLITARSGVHVTAGDILIGTSIPSGTPNQLLQVKGGGAYISGSLGIGTFSPVYNLQVNDGDNYLGIDAYEIEATSSSGLIINSSNAAGSIDFRVAGSEKARIIANGNVGIGTTNPGEKLEIQGNLRVGSSSTSNYIAFHGTTSDGAQIYNHTYIGERIWNDEERSELVLFKGNDILGTDGPDRIRLIGNQIAFDTYTSNTSGTFEQIATSGNVSNKMTLDQDGKLGIGLTNPSSNLHISGNAGTLLRIDGGSGGTGTRDIVITEFNTSAYGGIIRYDSGADLFTFGTVDNSTVINAINVTRTLGNVGVGLTNPTSKLHVSGDVNITGVTTASRFISTVSTGTAPFTVSSTTAVTNLNADLLDGQEGSYYLNYNNLSNTPTIGNGTLTLAVSGTGLSGSASFTANQSGNTTFTVTSNATSANTASAIVARDASGNFSAGTITATLSGNASGLTGYSGTYWTSNNDGSGSGLDADTLDGVQGSSFLRSDVSATNSVDLRAPIFYDSENTAYYMNGNGESRFYRHRIGPYAGSTTSGGVTGLELINNGGTGDSDVAAMSFHCSGTYATHMHLRADSYLGLGGWSASAWRWYVQMSTGDMTAAGNVTAYSDIRLKEEIQPLKGSLSKLLSLNGVSFKWKDLPDIVGHPGKKDYGIIAQEVEKVFPEVIHESAHESPDGDKYKTVAYDKLVPALIEAIKEQQEQINTLKERLSNLEK